MSNTWERTFDDYLRESWRQHRNNPRWRLGQAHFNVLREMRPDLAQVFVGSSVDPFNRDDRIPAFLEAVLDCWETA